ASDKHGMLITEGPHKDTQELQVPVFRWFNRSRKQEEPLIQDAAIPLFTAEPLKMFERLPEVQITSKCYENFAQIATDSKPLNTNQAVLELKSRTFGGWPDATGPPHLSEVSSAEYDGVRLTVYEFESQPGIALR